MDDTQTVAPGQGDSDASPQAEAEDNSGAVDAQEDDLDTLLSEVTPGEFEPEKEQTQDDEVKELASYVKEQRDKQSRDGVKAALDSAVSKMGDYSPALKALPETFLLGLLHVEGAGDKRFNVAFAERESNPGRWNRIIIAAAKKADQLLVDLPDPQLTADRAAATASIRGVSTTTPTTDITPQDIRKMSDAEIDAYNASGGK